MSPEVQIIHGYYVLYTYVRIPTYYLYFIVARHIKGQTTC